MLRIAYSALIALLLGACSANYQSGVPLPLSARTDRTVAVAVVDERPDVLAGTKAPNVVGSIRAPWGREFETYTSSGQPLAEEFTSSLATSLAANGVKAAPVPMSVQPRPHSVRILTSQGRERSLLVTIQEWKSEARFRSSLEYALRADVMDKSGKVLATHTVRDKTNLVSDNGNEASMASDKAARAAFTRLLDEPAIMAGLE